MKFFIDKYQILRDSAAQCGQKIKRFDDFIEDMAGQLTKEDYKAGEF
jgi:CRP-like cAMP-binding protein